MGGRLIVVLGAAVWPGGLPSPTLRRRTEWGIKLFLGGGFDRLVFSGGLGLNPPAEAEVMARIAIEQGVPEAVIVRDMAAKTTIETAAFAAALPGAAELQFVAVTDLYHGPRTWLAFKAYKLDAHLSCPPLGRTTRPWRTILSFLREGPGLLLYTVYYLRLHMRYRR
jgi:vancomycin permeability regulator SanA